MGLDNNSVKGGFLTSKENPKFSKSFIADMKEEKEMEGWGK